jgi:hypothetical protein
MSFPRLAGGLASAALLAGCSALPFGQSEDVFGRSDAPVTINVKNNNFSDATLWLVTRGNRVQLGTVTGKMERSFTARVSTPADVWYVEIDLIGGDWCRTEELDVDPGDVLDLFVAVDVSNMPGCYPAGRRPGG